MFRQKRQHGFTLIEVLVVLVIVAIITAVAVMAFGDFGRKRSEKIHVQTFVRMLQVAQSQAILTPAVLGLTITSTGYKFYEWAAGKEKSHWELLKNSVLVQPTAFSEFINVQVKLIAHYDPPKNGGRNSPAIRILPSGYVTPFVVELYGKGHHFEVSVENNGNVTVKTDNK